MKRSPYLLACGLLLCGLGVLLGIAAPLGAAETVIEARQKLMLSLIQATKVPRAMVKGETPFDEAAVKAAVKQVLEATATLPKLFPDGSSEGSSTLPDVFANRADFEARLIELEKTAVALAFSARQDPGEFAFAFGEYQAVCDGCHAKYRKPE